jgi:hypothetical protein
MRYVRHFLAGQGFVFNPGEPSAGITSPLWAFLMAGIARISGNTLGVYKAVSTALFALACALFAAMLRLRGWPTAAAVAGAAVLALEPHTLRWAASGMENGLACLCLVAAALCFTAPKPAQASGTLSGGALAGLLPFARPELALISFGSLSSAFVLTGARAWRFALGAAFAGLALAASMWTAFGTLIPQTAAAKALFLHQSDPWYALKQSMKILLSGASPCLLLLLAARPASPAVRHWRLVTLAAVALTVLYLGWRDHLVSTRYGTVLSAPIVVAALLTAADRARGGRPVRWQAAALASQVAISAIVLAWSWPATRIPEHQDIRKVAELVRRQAGPRARIALTEIGAFGFYSDLYIIDLVGLADRETLVWGRQHGAPQTAEELEDLLLHRRADFYVDAFAGPVPRKGIRLRFEPVGEVAVRRRNLSRGKIVPDIWRIYRLVPRP